jgi:hypothetical protein
MEFIETPTFTRLLTDLLTDDEYADLQNVLIENPERGDILKGGGGIRKLRHAQPGRGKSGGVRVIDYWLRNDGQIYMLLIYPKAKKEIKQLLFCKFRFLFWGCGVSTPSQGFMFR